MQPKNKNLPIQYKAGVTYFCETPFFVNKHVLIPRFDTEVLVEATILKLKNGARVLDMCTGSGCIAVIHAKHGFNVTAADISHKALKVARKNALLNDVNIHFVRSDLFNAIEGVFDAIVCNPPYVKTNEIGLQDASTLHEPRIALDGGTDGLDFYRRIASSAHRYLHDGGLLAFEIGYSQADEVQNILREKVFCDINVIKDHLGHNRVITCTKN